MNVPLFFRFKPNYLLHEGEYRIVQFLRDCAAEKYENGATMYFLRLPHQCVKAVYLGHRMDPKVRDEILRLLNGSKVLKFDAIPSREDYTLSFKNIQ